MSADAGVVRAGEPCPGCGRRPVRLDTRDGRLVEIDDPCRCPTWRRLHCVCRWCERPVTGKPKVAVYCERHRKAARAKSQQAYYHSTNGKYAREYRESHREELRIKARLAYQLDPEKRRQRNEYKREWRKRNRDKVRAQKRRAALRRGGETPASIVRWREEVEAGRRTPKRARRNARGDRLCLTPDCPSVMRGRAKKCERCKRREAAQPHEHARAA